MTDTVDQLIEDRDDAAELALAREPKSSRSGWI